MFFHLRAADTAECHMGLLLITCVCSDAGVPGKDKSRKGRGASASGSYLSGRRFVCNHPRDDAGRETGVIFGVILPGGDPRRGVKGGRLTTEAGSVPGGRLCGVPGHRTAPAGPGGRWQSSRRKHGMPELPVQRKQVGDGAYKLGRGHMDIIEKTHHLSYDGPIG